MSDTAVCFCGIVEITCASDDWAYCLDCDWRVNGVLSEHLGAHHFATTHHTWKLVWRDEQL